MLCIMRGCDIEMSTETPKPPGYDEWIIPFGSSVTFPDAPTIERAVGAVMDDLKATGVDGSNDLSIVITYTPVVGWSAGVKRGDEMHLRGFEADSGYAYCASQIADSVSDMMSGYLFIQWPVINGTMTTAEVRDGRALWVDINKKEEVAQIGRLSAV